jgi:hypothetical protein
MPLLSINIINNLIAVEQYVYRIIIEEQIVYLSNSDA